MKYKDLDHLGCWLSLNYSWRNCRLLPCETCQTWCRCIRSMGRSDHFFTYSWSFHVYPSSTMALLAYGHWIWSCIWRSFFLEIQTDSNVCYSFHWILFDDKRSLPLSWRIPERIYLDQWDLTRRNTSLAILSLFRNDWSPNDWGNYCSKKDFQSKRQLLW